MIILLQATTLMFLLQAAVMGPCVVLQPNILRHLDPQVRDRLQVQLLLGLPLLLVGLVLEVLLVIGIGIIGWEGKEWTSDLLLLGTIDQGLLVR
jgi:hypothetical protein